MNQFYYRTEEFQLDWERTEDYLARMRRIRSGKQSEEQTRRSYVTAIPTLSFDLMNTVTDYGSSSSSSSTDSFSGGGGDFGGGGSSDSW